MTAVSIALATCEGDRYLAQQLESFARQTRIPDELVVCDDASTDRTSQILQEFKACAPFAVRIIRNEQRRGYVANFGQALELTTGDLVFLSDQDDVWLPQKIEVMLAERGAFPEKLLFMNDADITHADLTRTGLTKLGQLEAGGSPPQAFVMGCCCAVSRELLTLCLPVPADARGHDNWLVDFSNRIGATRVVREALQLYRRHGDNESSVLANRTTAIGIRDRLRWQLSRALSPDSEGPAASEYSHKELLLAGLREAVGRCGGHYDVLLCDAAARLEKELQALLARRQIRRLPVLRRVPRALYFSMRGGYRYSSGVRSLVRDLMG